MRAGEVKRRRGSVMIEFALVIPAFLFLIMFSIDMGRAVFYSGVLHDAVQQAARTGAQVGMAGTDRAGPARSAFDRAVDAAPGMSVDRVASFRVVSGTVCGTYVTIRAEYRMPLVTPGLARLAAMAGGSRQPGFNEVLLGATSVARCEVTRT